MEALKESKTWLVTGCAGFIGSHLTEFLLSKGQKVIGVDNFSTGFQKNLDDVLKENTFKENFSFYEKDISDRSSLDELKELKVDYILHQAARGSVPRSVKDPVGSHESNVNGFLNVLELARSLSVKRFVYASSSSVYGDHLELPKKEDLVGSVLSPYAATKKINEIYADVYSRTYDLECVGLRYFNVFGKRQDPNGAYAAVIPKWVAAFLKGETIFINGDGETSRDFCYIKNVIEANIKSALSSLSKKHLVFNVAFGEQTSLNELKDIIADFLKQKNQPIDLDKVQYRDFRVGDIRHSLADISLAKKEINYAPSYSIRQGLKEALDWYIGDLQSGSSS